MLKPPGSAALVRSHSKGKLLHDGVADEFSVEEDLGPEAGSSNVEEDALALPFRGDVDLLAPPRDPEIGAVLRDGIVRGVAVLVGSVGALAEFAPIVLLDRSRKGDVDAVEMVEEIRAGGFVHGEWSAFAAQDTVLPRDVFGEE